MGSVASSLRPARSLLMQAMASARLTDNKRDTNNRSANTARQSAKRHTHTHMSRRNEDKQAGHAQMWSKRKAAAMSRGKLLKHRDNQPLPPTPRFVGPVSLLYRPAGRQVRAISNTPMLLAAPVKTRGAHPQMQRGSLARPPKHGSPTTHVKDIEARELANLTGARTRQENGPRGARIQKTCPTNARHGARNLGTHWGATSKATRTD